MRRRVRRGRAAVGRRRASRTGARHLYPFVPWPRDLLLKSNGLDCAYPAPRAGWLPSSRVVRSFEVRAAGPGACDRVVRSFAHCVPARRHDPADSSDNLITSAIAAAITASRLPILVEVRGDTRGLTG